MESGKKSSIECLIIVHELLRRPGTTNRERDVHDIRRVRQRLAESGWYDNGSLSHRGISVEDSPNSSGVVIDAIRCCKLALDRNEGGVLYQPSAYFMKHPPQQYPDDEAYNMTEAFIDGIWKEKLNRVLEHRPRIASSPRYNRQGT